MAAALDGPAEERCTTAECPKAPALMREVIIRM